MKKVEHHKEYIYPTERRVGYLNKVSVLGSELPWYPSDTSTRGHYIVLMGFDNEGYAYVIDPHYEDEKFGYHKLCGEELLEAIYSNHDVGWVLQSEYLHE